MYLPLNMKDHPYGFGFVVDDCAAQLREQRDSRASQLSQLSLQLSVEALEDFATSTTFPETKLTSNQGTHTCPPGFC